MTRLVTLSTFLLIVFFTMIASAQNAPGDLLNAGQKLASEGKLDEAFKVFEKASKASGQKCSTCFFRMAWTKMRLNDEGGAKKFANKAIEVAQTPQERSDAYALKGEVLLAFAEENKKEAAQAEAAYRAALNETPEYALLHARIGTCLVREDRLDEAKREFQAYLDQAPNSKDAPLVRRWIENPVRAKYTAAPEFIFTSLQGEKISLAQLAGKVVVLDFWGTWCPPCRASVPELKELTKKYPAEKLVVVSISSDTEEEKWTKFVADNKMDWPQYRDSDKRIQSLYHVHSFPTYIVIDKDGSIRERISGLNPQFSLRTRINEVLKKIL